MFVQKVISRWARSPSHWANKSSSLGEHILLDGWANSSSC